MGFLAFFFSQMEVDRALRVHHFNFPVDDRASNRKERKRKPQLD